jgi:hypothetical protein
MVLMVMMMVIIIATVVVMSAEPGCGAFGASSPAVAEDPEVAALLRAVAHQRHRVVRLPLPRQPNTHKHERLRSGSFEDRQTQRQEGRLRERKRESTNQHAYPYHHRTIESR